MCFQEKCGLILSGPTRLSTIEFQVPEADFTPWNPMGFDILGRDKSRKQAKDVIESNIEQLSLSGAKANLKLIGAIGPAGVGKTTYVQDCMRNDNGNDILMGSGWTSISTTVDLYNGIGNNELKASNTCDVDLAHVLGASVAFSFLKQSKPDEMRISFGTWFSTLDKSTFSLEDVIHRLGVCFVDENCDVNKKCLLNLHFDEIQSLEYDENELCNVVRVLGSAMQTTFIKDSFMCQIYVSGTEYVKTVEASQSTYYKYFFASLPPLSHENATKLIRNNTPSNLLGNEKEIEFLAAISTGFPRVIERIVQNLKREGRQGIRGEAILKAVSNEISFKYSLDYASVEALDGIVKTLEDVISGVALSYSDVKYGHWNDLQREGLVYIAPIYKNKDEKFPSYYTPIMPHAFVYHLYSLFDSQQTGTAEQNQKICTLMKLMNINDDAREWENIVACYETVKHNALARRKSSVKIGEIFKGASIYYRHDKSDGVNDGVNDGNAEKLLVSINQQAIGQLVHRFPSSLRPDNKEFSKVVDKIAWFDNKLNLRNKNASLKGVFNIGNNELININAVGFEYGYRFINAAGATWFDSFFLAKSVNSHLLIFGASNKRVRGSTGIDDVFEEDKYRIYADKMCGEISRKVIFAHYSLGDCTGLKNKLSKEMPHGIDCVIVISLDEVESYYSPTIRPFVKLLAKRVQDGIKK